MHRKSGLLVRACLFIANYRNGGCYRIDNPRTYPMTYNSALSPGLNSDRHRKLLSTILLIRGTFSWKCKTVCLVGRQFLIIFRSHFCLLDSDLVLEDMIPSPEYSPIGVRSAHTDLMQNGLMISSIC